MFCRYLARCPCSTFMATFIVYSLRMIWYRIFFILLHILFTLFLRNFASYLTENATKDLQVAMQLIFMANNCYLLW